MAQWKVIERFPDYEVSSFGDVRNRTTGVQLKPQLNGCYHQVELYNEHKKTTTTIHHLVATTFIPNPNEKPIVCHINNNKLDNNVCNLAWKTGKENEEHKNNNGVLRKDQTKKHVWKCNASTREKLTMYTSVIDAAKAIDQEKYKSVASNIRTVLCGKSNSSQGFFWMYDEVHECNDEEWKVVNANHINGSEGYQVSNIGRLRNKSGKLFSGNVNEHGYVRVCINKKMYRMHNIVARTFLDNNDENKTVRHKDGNKSNNRVSNLEWA